MLSLVATLSLVGSVLAEANPGLVGFGNKATGGIKAVLSPFSSIYSVKNYNQFKTALDNKGKPHAPKIIFIDGTIDGNFLPDGTVADVPHYASGTVYTWDEYLQSFNTTLLAQLAASSDPADAAKLVRLQGQESARYQASLVQKAHISVKVGNNTSILGRPFAKTSLIKNIAVAVNQTENVILQNFEVQAPIDLFPDWDPTDGATGNWNAGFDAIGLVGAKNVWIDHLSIFDGEYSDADAPVVFGKMIQRHDGAIDITEGSDYVTVSNSHFYDHDKTHLVGNNDADNLGPGDKGRLHISFYYNYWQNSLQRSPRVRFGQVHVFNNYYKNTLSEPTKLIYSIGMGIDSDILSEENVWEIESKSATTNAATYIVGNYKGYKFHDKGSKFNGTATVNIDAIAKTKYDVAKAAEIAAAATANRPVAEWATHNYTSNVFKPPYKYKLEGVGKVKNWVQKNAGSGKLKSLPGIPW